MYVHIINYKNLNIPDVKYARLPADEFSNLCVEFSLTSEPLEYLSVK
jgi:hypothetical protein